MKELFSHIFIEQLLIEHTFSSQYQLLNQTIIIYQRKSHLWLIHNFNYSFIYAFMDETKFFLEYKWHAKINLNLFNTTPTPTLHLYKKIRKRRFLIAH